MAGVRWEIMLFAMQAMLQESLLTKCLGKTCLHGSWAMFIINIMLIHDIIVNESLLQLFGKVRLFALLPAGH